MEETATGIMGRSMKAVEGEGVGVGEKEEEDGGGDEDFYQLVLPFFLCFSFSVIVSGNFLFRMHIWLQ